MSYQELKVSEKFGPHWADIPVSHEEDEAMDMLQVYEDRVRRRAIREQEKTQMSFKFDAKPTEPVQPPKEGEEADRAAEERREKELAEQGKDAPNPVDRLRRIFGA